MRIWLLQVYTTFFILLSISQTGDGSRSRRQEHECKAVIKVEGKILNYHDETLTVDTDAECRQACQQTTYTCRSISFIKHEQDDKFVCHLSVETKDSPGGRLMSYTGGVYQEVECTLPSATTSHPITPTADQTAIQTEDGSRQTLQQEECQVITRVEGSILNYNDDSVTVSTEHECRRACEQQQAFPCRSFSFSNQEAGSGTCYLSTETRESAGARLDAVAESVYEELNCTRPSAMTTHPTTPTANQTSIQTGDASQSTHQQDECVVLAKVEGHILNYEDKSLIVDNVAACQRSCQKETFTCRSISYIEKEGEKGTCYLSGETRDSPGGRLQAYPGSEYQELNCTHLKSTTTDAIADNTISGKFT